MRAVPPPTKSLLPIQCSLGSRPSPRPAAARPGSQGSRRGGFRQHTINAPPLRPLLGIALAALPGLFARPASASDRIGLALALEDCPFLQESEVSRVLLAELRVDPNSSPGFEPTRVVARCENDRLMIQVVDPISRKILRRNFALRVPGHPGISRLVGIAAAELVLASWAELSLNPTPRVEPEGEPPPGTLTAQARVLAEERAGDPATLDAKPSLAELPEPLVGREPSVDLAPRLPHSINFRVLGLASGRSFFSHSGALWGGGVRVGADPSPRLSWAADLLFETGKIRRPETRFTIDTWTLGTQLFFLGQLPPVSFRLGAGLRAGLAASSSRAENEDIRIGSSRAIAPWGWPLLAANVGIQLGRVMVELSSEASFVVLPVSRGSSGQSIRGTWFSAQLGVGYLP